MRGVQVPVVLLPRYTSFIEPGTYTMTPLNVEPYSRATITVWRGLMPPFGGTGTVRFYLEDSHDGNTWAELNPGGVDPGPDAVSPVRVDLKRRWLRIRTVVGGDPGIGVSCWAVGNLEKRTDGEPGA